MSIQEALQKKKAQLNQVQTRQRQVHAGDIECKSSEDYYRLMEETQFEQYYSIIAPYTFKSVMFPLSPETAQAIMDAYKVVTAKQTIDIMANPYLAKLAQDIDAAKSGKLTTKYIFVRLSSRSPKDAAIGERGIKLYQQAKKKVTQIAEELNDTLLDQDSIKLHALYITGTEALRVETGLQAVDLLVHSNRIQQDLEHFIQISHATNSTPTTYKEFNIVVREFADFEVELEFRAFVYGKKVTAITQYNQFCYFPRVKKYKKLISTTICKFIEEELISKGINNLNNFVLDLILVSQTPQQGPYSNLKVHVVEVNPFAEFAGEGLFSWTDEVDILKGRAPFEFRIVESPVKGAIKNIDSEWRSFIEADI